MADGISIPHQHQAAPVAVIPKESTPTMKQINILKTMFLIGFLTISIPSICQKVTYKNLAGTSWVLFDSSRALTMTLKFIDSSHLSQKSGAPRYQQSMTTVIRYSLDTTQNPTLLNVEWEGEVLKCKSCSIKILDRLLVIENSNISQANKSIKETEGLQTKWIFKKVAPKYK
jgi:hypothetical protein